MSETNDLTHLIGGIVVQSAQEKGGAWDYAGWAFRPDGENSYSDLRFRFEGRIQSGFDLSARQQDASKAMFDLRNATKGEDGKPWCAALVVVRAADKALRILFEFEDNTRWTLTPSVLPRRFEVFVGDAFPDALET